MPIIKPLIQNSPEWHEYRRTRVGASEIAPIMDVDDAFSTRQQVMLNKLGQKTEFSDYSQKIMADGHEWEDVMRGHINKLDFNFQPIVVEDEENSRFFASLDGHDPQKNLILEIKLITSKKKFDKFCELGVQGSSKSYWLQVQWQLMISKAAGCVFVFGFEGQCVQENISPDPLIWPEMRLHAARFLTDFDDLDAKGIIEVDDPEIRALAHMKKGLQIMKAQTDEVEDLIKEKAESILKRFGSNVVMGWGLKVEWCERAGSVDYSKVPELKGVNLEKYRKKPSRYVKVTAKDADVKAVESRKEIE